MEELWKDIPGFSRYQASNTGKLRSLSYKNMKSIKELKPAVSEGYLKTMILNDDKKYKTIRVHKMIALAFLGYSQLEVNHKDGNKLNNNINNLEYCTHSENAIHSFKMGLQIPIRGSKVGGSKLKEYQIKEIREYAKENGYLKNRKSMALKYGVSEATLKDVVSQRRNNWSHV